MDRRSLIKAASFLAGSVAVGKILFNPSQAQEIKVLNFGIISTESQANQKPIWNPFLSAMSEQISIPVKAFYANQYAGVIEAMRFGQIDLAWYGGKAYIEAAKRAQAEVFAQTVREDGSKGYYSHLIMPKNHPDLAKAKEIGGDKYVVENAAKLKFAFNDPNSTSGYLIPSYYFSAQNSINLEQAVKRLLFAGNHEATALAIANNQVDVATNNSESLARLAKTNPTARKNIKIIWTSNLIPNDLIAWRKDIPDEIKTKLREFFYNYQDRDILAPLGWSGFTPATDDMWNPLREINISKQILEIKSNNSLSERQKEPKIAELKQQLLAIKS